MNNEWTTALADAANAANTLKGHGRTDYVAEDMAYVAPKWEDERQYDYDAFDYYRIKGVWPEGYNGPYPDWD